VKKVLLSYAIFGVTCLMLTQPLPAVPDDAPGKPPETSVKPTEAPAKPVSSKKVDPSVTAINDAVKKLGDEFRAYLKDPEATPIRQTSDYFTTSPNPDVTPEVIYKTLERSLASDARVDAYVKWQLLSGLPSVVDDKDVGRIIRLYSRAPLPTRHPGMDRQPLQRALQSAGASNIANENVVNNQFSTVLNQYTAQNATIVNYRMALFQRMPVRPDAIAAGWEDVRQRVRLGAPAGALTDALDSATRSWMLGGATPSQKRAMRELITSVWKEADNREIHPYDRVAWDERGNLLTWRTSASASPGRLKTLIDDLRKSESNSGTGMN
jgi:hypothetical protein